MKTKILSILVALMFVLGFASMSPAFEVTKPAAGESVPTGALYTASWTAQPGAVFYKIKLSIDGGVTWLTLGALNSTSASWPVPATIKKNLTTTMIKVIAYDNHSIKIGVAKSGIFTVDVLTIKAPVASEVVPQNLTYSITWRANGTEAPPDDAVVKYTLNNGVTWKTAQGTLNLGSSSFRWKVPAVSATETKAKVKVVLKSNGTTVAKAVSNIFTVQ